MKIEPEATKRAIKLEVVRAERLPDTEYFKGGYCFDVLRDGVKIATWRPICVQRGYTLTDLAGVPVRAPWIRTNGERGDLDSPWHWRTVECSAQAEFFEQVMQELDYIPTKEQIEKRQCDEQTAKEREAAERAEEQRIARIKEAGPELLSDLRMLVETVDAGTSADYRALQEHAVMRNARATISKVTILHGSTDH